VGVFVGTNPGFASREQCSAFKKEELWQKSQIRIVLFDVGGVLVELPGVPTMLAWMGNRVLQQEPLRMWLTSPVVKAFETGRATPEVFADQLIAEMALPVGRDQLLHKFSDGTLGEILAEAGFERHGKTFRHGPMLAREKMWLTIRAA
jgi:hypothetical protein